METCFVIAPIGEPESETRKRSDQILKHVITPAVTPLGYVALRADQIAEPGLITSQVIQHIVNDSLVIADLTDRNPNVFYELAIRHAIRKPLIQIIKKGELIPFDIAGSRTIFLDYKDLDSVDAAKYEIAKQIDAVTKDATQVDTPISVAMNLQLLRQSDDPEKNSLADIVTQISEMRTRLEELSRDLAILIAQQQITSAKAHWTPTAVRAALRRMFPNVAEDSLAKATDLTVASDIDILDLITSFDKKQSDYNEKSANNK